jgi:hypothetical protein
MKNLIPLSSFAGAAYALPSFLWPSTKDTTSPKPIRRTTTANPFPSASGSNFTIDAKQQYFAGARIPMESGGGTSGSRTMLRCVERWASLVFLRSLGLAVIARFSWRGRLRLSRWRVLVVICSGSMGTSFHLERLTKMEIRCTTRTICGSAWWRRILRRSKTSRRDVLLLSFQ